MKTLHWIIVASVAITPALLLGCPVPDELEAPKLGMQNPDRVQGGEDTTEKVMEKPSVVDNTLPQPAKRPSSEELDKPIPWGQAVTMAVDASVPPPDASPADVPVTQ